jgi:hypothetical protein
MKRYLISPEDAQKFLTYLSRKPYAEVFELVAVLQNMEETDVEEPVFETLETVD